jgi:hypothetical protein
MAKKLYRIPVEWAVTGTMLVEADSLAEALIEAEEAPLPEATDYIEGTFEVNRQMIPYVNKNLTKEEIKSECYETI